MKLEQLIVQYLYNNKKVTIQDIGTFTLSSDVVLPPDNEKESVLPAGAISFDYDGRAAQDEDLIEFITQQTRKIRPLAASDLESYSILSKQFLNIGKPLAIEGLGSLQKNQQGIYEFTQGHTVNARLESAPARTKEKDTEEISFRSSVRKDPNASKKVWFIVLALLFVALAGVAIFYLLYKNDKKTPEAEIPAADTSITTPVTVPIVDTTNKTVVIDTTAKIVVPAADGSNFKVVIKEYATKQAAEKAYARLTRYGHKLILSPIDSIRYKISMPFNTPISDSTRARDSLAKFFQSKTYIDLR